MKMLRIARSARVMALALAMVGFALPAAEAPKYSAGKMLRDAAFMPLKAAGGIEPARSRALPGHQPNH